MLTGDLTTIGQLEYFAVTVPAGQNLVVTLHTAGYSLLVPNLNVFDANGNLLKNATTNQPWMQDESVNFGGQNTAKTYYVQVSGAANSVFGLGGFQLELGSHNPPNLQQPTVNQDKNSNGKLASATPLAYSSVAINDYSYYATMNDINGNNGSHYYQFTAPASANNATEAMLVSVMSLQNGNGDPGLHVYDQNGTPQAFQILTNDGLNYMIQLTNIVPGATYFVQTTPQSPTGSKPGDYHLCINFGTQGTTVTSAVAGNTLSESKQTDTGSLNVSQAALLHFALSANKGSSTVPVNVTMTITDSTGKTLYTLTALAGQPPVTLDYYLGAGNYSISYKATLAQGAPGGSTIPAVSFELDAGVFSDPQGPFFTGGSGGTGSSGSIAYSGTNQDLKHSLLLLIISRIRGRAREPSSQAACHMVRIQLSLPEHSYEQAADANSRIPLCGLGCQCRGGETHR